MQTTLNSSSKRILVIKHGALGDIVQGFGSFASLRFGHRDANISLLTTPPFVELAEMMPWFDEVFVDHRASFVNIVEGLRIRRLLRSDWDIVVDLQCSQRTAYYFHFFAHASSRWVGTVKNCSDPCPDFTGINNHQRMMVAADIAGGERQVADMAWLLNGTPAAFWDLQRPYAILVPGCSLAKPQKRWPAEKFADLATRLLAWDFAVVLVGTTADLGVVNLVQSLEPKCINLCSKTSIADLAGLSANADYVVGNDTGPVFLAAASGAPTIMVMGPSTDPSMSAPNGDRCRWLKGSPITEVTVDDVLDVLKSLTRD